MKKWPFPFDYDLHLTAIAGTWPKPMICFHGYGANYQLIEWIKESTELKQTLVGFNFPDHDLVEDNPNLSSFGTIRELLPALYVLKTYAIDKGFSSIDLYGFSAGGGALINTIGVLNTSVYDKELEKIGIFAKEKAHLLQVIQNGRVFLDAPLKSIDEILDFRGPSAEFEIYAKRYRENGFRPIDSLKNLENLSLHITLYFEIPDEVLSNRDDALFIERLKKYNSKGTTDIIRGSTYGHNTIHSPLWKKIEEEGPTSNY